MAPQSSFAADAIAWQNFYLLVGGAAATLTGLMFVAVTFGAGFVKSSSLEGARAFLDPPLTHFVQVLATACLVTIPTMGPSLLGTLLLIVSVVRVASQRSVFHRMLEAHRKFNDLEFSDWAFGIGLPVICHLLLGVSAAGFLTGRMSAFNGLAIVTVALLLVGIIGAWELLIWIALQRSPEESAGVEVAVPEASEPGPPLTERQ